MSSQTILNRLDRSLRSIANFLALLAVSAGSTPVNTAILWGVLGVAVQVSAMHSS